TLPCPPIQCLPIVWQAWSELIGVTDDRAEARRMVSRVAWCRLMRFWRQKAEVVGRFGVGASPVVLSRGGGATGIFDWAFVVELSRLPAQGAAGVRWTIRDLQT